jgi:hypothetical protein
MSREIIGTVIHASLTSRTKLMQTFRMPHDLVLFLKSEAALGGRDLTSHVIRCLDGFRTYCGLPEAATSLLEADRRRLQMGRYEYLLHALYERSLDIREKGAGFDAPRSDEAASR